MKSVTYFIIISVFLAFMTIAMLSAFKDEFGLIGLFPGFMLNWATEQILIEILREPYFSLDNIDAFFDLNVFGELGRSFLVLIAKNLSVIFNFIFYSFIYFSLVHTLRKIFANEAVA